MDSSKIKNFIIVVLVIVNILLLAVVGVDGARARAAERRAMDGVSDIFAAQGIALSPNLKTKNTNLPVRSVSRAADGEQRRVASLLGDVTVQDQGGSILFYSGEKGQAVFRGTGGFEILMNDGAIPTGRDAENTARAFLKKLGVSAVSGHGSAISDVEDGSGTVVLRCRSGKTEVVGCKVTFTFTNGSLLLVIGSRPLEVVSTDRSGEALDVPTVLLRFLNIVSEGGHICSELRNLEPCYMQSTSASGTGFLTPVWRVTTDAGEFYINGLTGKQELPT
ncbi:MAG: hypothetical protein RR314_00045 [Oscillospiraceae bacterium]